MFRLPYKVAVSRCSLLDSSTVSTLVLTPPTSFCSFQFLILTISVETLLLTMSRQNFTASFCFLISSAERSRLMNMGLIMSLYVFSVRADCTSMSLSMSFSRSIMIVLGPLTGFNFPIRETLVILIHFPKTEGNSSLQSCSGSLLLRVPRVPFWASFEKTCLLALAVHTVFAKTLFCISRGLHRLKLCIQFFGFSRGFLNVRRKFFEFSVQIIQLISQIIVTGLHLLTFQTFAVTAESQYTLFQFDQSCQIVGFEAGTLLCLVHEAVTEVDMAKVFLWPFCDKVYSFFSFWGFENLLCRSLSSVVIKFFSIQFP